MDIDSDRSQRDDWSHQDWLALGITSLAGALIRVAYVLALEISPYDPWRHLTLIRNLRSGAGFTLFDGQPYIWYQPPWYWLNAMLPETLRPEWVAALFSTLCVGLLYAWIRMLPASRFVAACAAALMAGFGPAVRFTCHSGQESFGLFLLLASLALTQARRDGPTTAAAGLLCGTALVVRLNLAFNVFLFIPLLRRLPRAAAFAAGAALPLMLTWWRNHRVIGDHTFLFSWDGLATRTEEFNVVSTFVLQMHPAIREGLSRLHEQIIPRPEWVGVGFLGAFMLLATICCLVARRALPLVAFGSGLVYLLFLERTGSGNWFRIWLPLFPVMFLGIALVAGRLFARPARSGRWQAGLLAGAALACGVTQLSPPVTQPLEMVTPPAELLQGSRYMVNSGFYHPESLVYRFPGKRFIGLPIDPAEYGSFAAEFSEYREIVWHNFSVQDDLRRHLTESGRFKVAARARNRYGYGYERLEPR